ncbi:hypothetical protein BUE80_DR008087 [Diplocarpon rosae]|nr:hypothetical protein BUE80_DR008087 [Diplocarpon rosae]
MECSENHPYASPPDSPEPVDESLYGADPPIKKPGSKGKGPCRKRRIKCGEEKPKCGNCAKSKRQCEGYNQRVVFKDPMSAYHQMMASNFKSSSSLPNLAPSTVRFESYHQSRSGQLPLPIAPELSENVPVPANNEPTTSQNDERHASVQHILPSQVEYSGRPKPVAKVHFHENALDSIGHSHVLEGEPVHNKITDYELEAGKQDKADRNPYISAKIRPSDWSARPNCVLPLLYGKATVFPYQSYPPVKWEASPSASMNSTHSRSWKRIQHAQKHPPRTPNWDLAQSAYFDSPTHNSVEQSDDPFDLADKHEDMEMDMGDNNDLAHDEPLRNNDLGIVVAVQARRDRQRLNVGSFVSSIDRADILATYTPSLHSTPLRDKMTARIFCHFVNVTAPCMSMFERHPANPSLIFQGTPVPKSQQHIWTYTFPTIALQNSALLHAMLAITSLHISKLQNGPITASYKHYALSLRRVAKSVSLPTRRGHPATLAAALLLAFYECWLADHQKWSNHLFGAKQLIKEIDFAGLTKHIKRQKTHERQYRLRKLHYAQEHGLKFSFDDSSHLRPADEVDENIVGNLMGRKVSYDEYGQIIDDRQSKSTRGKKYTKRDIEIYETQRDLFWWYCKQDSYQGILGGGKLFLEYSFWNHCPPRAPIGRLNAIYGTFDHVVLILGRLATFAAKDLKRKRLAMKANGGRWLPPESMRTQTHPSRPQGNSFSQILPEIPGFSGMVPGVKEAELPMGFEPSGDGCPHSTQTEENADLHTQTHTAREEWQEIRRGFDLIESHLGEDFQALGPDYSAPVETPFGPALQYRTYSIAGIWMNFYMGLVACYRAHPDMPPAAMMAAGITARQTAGYANQVGRIAAGIAPDLSMITEVSPSVGAALIESSTCIFVSAVQYVDPAQRDWTIRRLGDIARLTGWQTALAISLGCETCWVKMSEMGRGPVYTRATKSIPVPDTWTSSRRIDKAMEGKTNEEKRMVIENPDRVQYALGVLGIEEDFAGLDLECSK